MEENEKKKKWVKPLIITLSCVILVPLIVALSYVGYVALSYHRIGDVDLKVNSKASLEKVETNKELSYTSYNIGFGAYSDYYTFFMDTGYDANGNPTQGTYGKAISKEDVIKNINGAITAAKSLNSDFYAIQEVDEDSDRAYHINQKEKFMDAFSLMDSTYCINFDSAYLFYPFNDPHGKSKAGLTTFSKYKISSANRKEYTISTSFSKFFDLDRCFSVNRIKTSNAKELVLINSHMSAYDEGGLIRNKQLTELNSFMVDEYNKGNYVVCGGDFNHDLLTNNPMYPEYNKDNFAYKNIIKQQKPDWISYMFDDNKESKFDSSLTIYAANNEPSCRDCDVVYTPGDTFVSTVDGFIVSKNVSVTNVTTTKTVESKGFSYSDHQPTTLKFKLN